ncbi:MAG: glucose-6-phosphate isomerase, partial [Gemmatimonadota bacterium]|nr:glucose-6-phosphate isomerase [Gemmatimonadota bacterium]
MPLRLDDARMMAAAVPSGVAPTEWNDLAIRFGDVYVAVTAERAAGRYGFLELEAQAGEIARIREYVAGSAGRFDDVVVLGIGGSALGALALRTALGGATATPRLHVLDNVDPATMHALLAVLAPARTLWCVISKSGGTVETLSQYAIARAWVERAGLPTKWHFAVVTDPEVGPLRALARRDGLAVFAVPANVGGRFSVFTPVGTLPAALAGYDLAEFLAGAQAMRDRCDTPTLSENPAGLLATLLWRAHQRAGQGTHVMMPYSDALQAIAPWFVQLWGESLGKRDA